MFAQSPQVVGVGAQPSRLGCRRHGRHGATGWRGQRQLCSAELVRMDGVHLDAHLRGAVACAASESNGLDALPIAVSVSGWTQLRKAF
jgi:hypothetical protein